jgi:hypothetical protein
VAGLAWFDRVWIPTQQQYVNERNLRALRTISDQIKAKVDNFDLAIDHAIDSFPIEDGNHEHLRQYVKLFSPELEIVTFNPNEPAGRHLTPADPPNVRIVRDEGRSYLYLGYRHDKHRKGQAEVTKLIARGDIERVAAASLTGNDFDALLLLDGHGTVIAERGSSGLEFTSIERLHERGQDASSTTGPSVFERIRGTTNLGVVTIGAADYMVYSQPVQLSLIHEEKHAEGKPAEDKRAAETPEEWTLCGLVRLDRFRAASSTISTTYWLWFGVALALVCFAIPLLKFRIVRPRERLRRVDGVLATVATFMMMALAAFTALDLYVFRLIVPAAVDDQLAAVARTISENVRWETEAIAGQMTVFDDGNLWRKLENSGELYHSLSEVRDHLGAGEDIKINLDINPDAGARPRSQCTPTWSCRSAVLSQLGELDYPFFKMMVWSDDAGQQRIKWSTSSVVTPFFNIAEAKQEYFETLALARRLSSSDPGIPTSGVGVAMSPNTGEKLTSFWRALSPLDHADPAKPDLTGEALVTTPMSLTAPFLPYKVRFAVLDREGRVLFHSDPARSLTENFLQESEDNPKLRSLMAGRGTGALSGRYLGRTRRFYVTPLYVNPFGDPEWSLVVFEDAAVSETANIQTLNLALSMFGVYALALGALWALLAVRWPRAWTKWLWPDPMKGPQYQCAAKVGAAAGLICLSASALPAPAAVLFTAPVLIVGAVAAMFLIVRAAAKSSRESATWLADFFRIRASLLFLLAAVPTLLCFQVAYGFHNDLVLKRGQSHLADALAARAHQIDAEMRRKPVCTGGDAGSQPCPQVGQIVTYRAKDTLWDVHIPVTSRRLAETTSDVTFASAALRWFLELAYRPYNDTAADLLMAPLSRPSGELDTQHVTIDSYGQHRFTTDGVANDWQFEPAVRAQAASSGVFWLIAVGLIGAGMMFIAYLLVRYLLAPLFALDINPRSPLRAAKGAADETSLLVIGPPGSGASDRVRHPRVHVFDVRSLLFTDDPMERARSTPDQISTAADHGPTIEEDRANWPEAMHLALSRSVIVALDHLEYRLDDRSFREQMLDCLEPAVYGRGATIWCSLVRDPIELLDELDPRAPDRHRWAHLFEGFRCERLGLERDCQRTGKLKRSLEWRAKGLAPDVRSRIVSECEVAPELLTIGERLASRLPSGVSVTIEAVLAEISDAAVHVYEALWEGCSTDERVVLHQLAEEGLVNPKNPGAVSRLLDAGLVHRDPSFRVMNETFRRFVFGAASSQVISAWEREGVLVPWGTIATTGLTVAFGLAGLLLLTQEQLVDAWIRYVPTLAPSIPTVWKVLASARKGRIEVTA